MIAPASSILYTSRWCSLKVPMTYADHRASHIPEIYKLPRIVESWVKCSGFELLPSGCIVVRDTLPRSHTSTARVRREFHPLPHSGTRTVAPTTTDSGVEGRVRHHFLPITFRPHGYSFNQRRAKVRTELRAGRDANSIIHTARSEIESFN